MIILYSNVKTKDTILELWGASTKHPDGRFNFKNFKKSIWVDEEHQIFQWLLECASKLNFPCHAYQLMKFAENYYETDKDKHDLEIILRM